MAQSLTVLDRLALVGGAVRTAMTGRKALVGTLPTDRSTVGGRLVTGVISAGGYPPPRGTKDALAAYGSTPWLRAVVSRISYDVAAVEWELYAKKGPDGRAVRDHTVKMLQRAPEEKRVIALKAAVESGDVERIHDHPLLDLLDRFNVFHTGLAGRRLTQQHLDLAGEAFWILERDLRRGGMPIGLWPVPPSWVLGTPTVGHPYFRVSFKGWQGDIPATEVVWFSELDPSNPYARGTGTAQALADEIETDEYAARHVKAFFYNRARPDLVVSPKEGEELQEPDVRRLENDWTNRTGGFWRAFKPFFMKRAVDIKELGQDLKSQQFVDLRKFQRDTCIQVFGVSPEILGIIASGSNRATVSVAEYIYGRRTLVPRCESIRATLQERVVPEFDERLVLGYVSPVAADAEMEQKAYETTPWAFTIDEHRARGGKEPLADDAGRFRMVPPLLTPIDDAAPDDAADLPLNEPGLDTGATDEEVAAMLGNARLRA